MAQTPLQVIQAAWGNEGQANLPGMCVSYYDSTLGELVAPLGWAVLDQSDPSQNIATTVNTIFELASVTKVFTSALLAFPYFASSNYSLTDPVAPLISKACFVTLGYALIPLYGTNTGGTYDSILADFITSPTYLDMPNTGTNVQPLAHGYRNLDCTPVFGTPSDIKSSGTDMLQFIKGQLGVAPSSPPYWWRDGITLTHKANGPYSNCSGKGQTSIGLAWQISSLGSQSPTLYWKNGATGRGGQSCAICFIPDGPSGAQVGISVLTNQVFDKGLRPAGTGPTATARWILSQLHPWAEPLFEGVTEAEAEDA